MVLEEKISFYSREDAAEFQKFLRGKEVGSRITVEHLFSGDPYFEGTISSFMHLISLLEKKDAEEGETDEELALTKKDLEERIAKLEEFFREHKEGDLIQNSTPTQMMAQVQSIDAESDEAFRKEAAEKFVSSLTVLATLEDNGLLKETEDGNSYILTGTADAEDLRVMYAYEEFSSVTTRGVKECNISSHIRTSSLEKYVVTVGTEIIFTDTDELLGYFDDADVDGDELSRFIDNIFFKQALIGKIHELIEGGCTSEEKLVEALGAPAFPLEGCDDVISFDISPEYVSEVISDLKKLGIVAGKDGKFKNI